jgi:hypothetical protein
MQAAWDKSRTHVYQVCLAVILYNRIREHTNSVLGWDIGYPGLGLSWFFSVPLRKLRDSISIIPRPLPSRSFPRHHSSIILTFGAMQFGTLTATLLKVNHYGEKRCTKFRPVNRESTNYLEDLHIHTITLRWILKERGGDIWTEFSLLRIGDMNSVSTKRG